MLKELGPNVAPTDTAPPAPTTPTRCCATNPAPAYAPDEGGMWPSFSAIITLASYFIEDMCDFISKSTTI